MATKTEDPKQKFPAPPFKAKEQLAPGSDAKMQPKPDYGESSYTGSDRLKGKAALITGADSGIGKAVALAFAREGADIAFTYLNERIEGGDAEETVRFVESAGRTARAIPGDIRDESFCQKLVQETISAFGHLDILVNNAAYQQTFDSFMDITEEELDTTFRTNVYSIFFLTKAAFPLMKPGSVIINTTSIQAFHPSPELLPYCATKGAVKIITQAFSQEAIKKGVRVNGVAPGPIWTPLIPSSMDPENFGTDNPTGRPGQPAELAPIYVLLASDEASYVNGEIWSVTGGAMAQ